MGYVIWFLVVLSLAYLVLFISTYMIPKHRKTLGESKAIQYIIAKYDLKMNKKRIDKLARICVLANSVILAIPLYTLLVIQLNYYLSMVLAFFAFISLILIIYNFIGKLLKKKGW